MKITLETALNSIGSIQQLANTAVDSKLAYKISRVFTSLNSARKALSRKIEEAAKNLAEADDNGNPIIETVVNPAGIETKSYKLTEENKEILNAKVKEFQNEEIEIWGEPISIDQLANIQIRPVALTNLEWFIVENSEKLPNPQ